MRELARGSLAWADFNPTRGRERAGERPAVIVASNEYLKSVPNLVIALPVTPVERGWPHHARLGGESMELGQPS